MSPQVDALFTALATDALELIADGAELRDVITALVSVGYAFAVEHVGSVGACEALANTIAAMNEHPIVLPPHERFG